MYFKNARITAIAIGLLCIAAFIATFVFRFGELNSRLHLDQGEGRIFSPPIKLPPFKLIDHKGQAFTNKQLQGHWTLISIGFTYCPDVCPMTLAKLADFYDKFVKEEGPSKRPECIFLSVDPFRDSPKILADYVTFYRPEFLGLTGAPEEIFHLIDEIGLYYRYATPDGKTIFQDVLHRPEMQKYSVVHSSQILIINPDNMVVAMIMQPFEPTRLLELYKKITKD
ncbi:SCO family protein [Desulfobulbus rhabdoformis]|uniref:SCO family protein n=1 Tax=Desulfobulbus rhabdoformis TaxID=34032 RepID=UPI001962805E|nr:SCO family protein [Desulfobulbus rhabdoformis]MBM9615082.1 SCO family protein [Desulfobulbus rhabdoformis]